MRAIVLMLCFLCAALSGWTSALGQTQHLAALKTENAAVMQHAAHAGHAAATPVQSCGEKASPCGKSGQPGHPLLCAACYAIFIDDPVIERHGIENGRIAPALEAHLIGRALKPRFPPPRSILPA
ncbi:MULTISPECIES: hypothetical protein [unclassified Rhizobium]|uniref:hypothetical protein n=1 Tax=unclassified Rhizobium TaxID=2613769 RepID=UPI0012E38FCE|nr:MULTISPECIES: hypothetical protein [unclassified Rhizobium]